MKLGSCFPCMSARKKEDPPSPPADLHSPNVATAARNFPFKELEAATRNFRNDCRVVGREPSLYKGYLKSVDQVVAIKLQRANPHGSTEQVIREFRAHVQTLSALRHPNLVNLIGFCADGNHMILVHEYMPLGSLENHLHNQSPGKAPLDWNRRIKIAAGVAKGLEYMHDKGVVYSMPMRSSKILLGDGHHAKLSQYGLAELDQLDVAADKGWAIAFPWTTTGTLAPEIAETGKLSLQSSVYSFGVVLLEMITGRRVSDDAQAAREDRLLVTWARPLLKDKREFSRMADPGLEGRYPPVDLQQALEVASVCIHENPAMRAPIGTVLTTLSRLAHDVDGPESPHHAGPR